MKLGENILKLRKQQGLSQEQLGERVGVTRQTISNWELEETAPNPEQLKLLSKALNVSIDELLDNEIKGELMKKVSNTEQLAGMAIKILKVIKIIAIVYIMFMVIAVVGLGIYTFVIKNNQNIDSSATTICSMNNKKCSISFGANDYFKCEQCSDEMKNDLIKLTDFNNIDESINNIDNYFKKNNGTCE